MGLEVHPMVEQVINYCPQGSSQGEPVDRYLSVSWPYDLVQQTILIHLSQTLLIITLPLLF